MSLTSAWLSPVASGVDTFFREAVLNRAPKPPPARHAERVALLHEAIESTVEPWMFADRDRFFPLSPIVAMNQRAGRSLVPGVVTELRWKSAFEPIFEENEALFARLRRNERARARLVQHDPNAPRPTLLLIHGFMGGVPDVEERLFPVRELFEAGFDLAIPTLPGHAGRKDGGRFERPRWPAKSPRFTIDGYRQAVADLRALIHHLRDRGAPSVGVIGMSLGGYTSALLATIEPELRVSIPFIPLASIAQYMFDNRQLAGSREEQSELRELVETLFSPVSPMARPVLVPSPGRKVIAGRVDRITPLSHASRIARHFGVEVDVFEGGHLIQWGKTQALLSALSRSRGSIAWSGA
jgi:pimeloyl-ACP methyl ester carboxylesterase